MLRDPIRVSAAELPPGMMVGGYRVEYRLGAGGVGTVYAAEEPTIRKRVAIKVLRHSFAEDAAASARFEREARAANDVKHPGIVDVFAIGKLDDGRPYLVMSLLEGRSLRQEISARGRLDAAEAWAIGREVAEALAAAHATGIVHRDLKPDNVFLERFGAAEGRPARPRILDFGLAKVQAGDDDDAPPMKLTQSGVPMGTPAYMAPEQWWGVGVDARTDQYAFGVMLFEMLAGRPPFGSQQYIELAQQHLHGAPPRLADLGAPVSPAIEAFVARALAKRPEDRFASMSELLRAGDAAFADADAGGDEGEAHSARPRAGASIDAAAPTPLHPAVHRHGDPRTPAAIVGEDVSGAAATLPATPGDAASLATAPPLRRPLARFLALHAALIVAGVGAILAAGYAGADRHAPIEWLYIAGYAGPAGVAMFLIGAALIVVAASRRVRTGERTTAIWWLTLLPAIGGALGTYTGWLKVGAFLGELPTTLQFKVYNAGMYEANAARFVGFWASAILMASLAAMPGVSGALSVSSTLVAGLGVRRRESLAATFGLLALVVAAAVVRAPSGALIAGVAAAVLLSGVLLPAVHPVEAARDELERALAGMVSVGLAVAVGFARLEAREAALWHEQPTRAARAAELVSAAGERTATTAIAVASVLVVLVVEAIRVRRLWPRARLRGPGPGTLALAAVVAAVALGDQLMHDSFLQRRDGLRRALAPQFVLFAKLDPPAGDALDAERFAPHTAPALQIARDRVAVNGEGVALLAALKSPEVAFTISGSLSRALATTPSGNTEGAPTADAPDLSVCIDREVPWATVERLLQLARDAGVGQVEILLTRGPSPSLPPSAPPEAAYAIAGDFVALRAQLGAEGTPLPADARFGKIAPELVARALAGEQPLRLHLPR
jgi:tRNA A-37 threonylcarbamoyl transferase component Bud32